MCELCELKDKAKEAMQFRIVQMQMEIQEAKQLAREKFEELVSIVQEHAEIERHHMGGGGLLIC